MSRLISHIAKARGFTATIGNRSSLCIPASSYHAAGLLNHRKYAVI